MKGARSTKLPSHTSIQRILLALHIPKHVDSSDKHTHLLVIVAFTPVTLAEERRWAVFIFTHAKSQKCVLPSKLDHVLPDLVPHQSPTGS